MTNPAADTLLVYVPVPGTPTAASIEPGSGVVARTTEATSHPATGARPLVLADYEGNLYGSTNLARYADRVLHAHGRADTNYPTVARRLVPADELIYVGTLDTVNGSVEPADAAARAAISAWTGTADADLDVELTCSGARYESRRAIIAARASGDPAQRFAADQLAKRLHITI